MVQSIVPTTWEAEVRRSLEYRNLSMANTARTVSPKKIKK
jgi:hypothetical protein